MDAKIRAGLVAHVPAVLVDELVAAYEEAKRNFFLGGLRLSAVEGGRFCEAAYRIVQHVGLGAFDPLGVQIDTGKVANKLSNLPVGSKPESVRLHIPRALRVVYDIRNNRDAAHLADGIDPNMQDAMLVVSVLDWVLAEFVRLFHNVSPNKAQAIVEAIVTREVPAVQDFDGFPKVLRTDLKAGDFAAVLLYQRGASGATFDQLNDWVKPTMRTNLARTLYRLVHESAMVHEAAGLFKITYKGQKHVESKRLIEP